MAPNDPILNLVVISLLVDIWDFASSHTPSHGTTLLVVMSQYGRRPLFTINLHHGPNSLALWISRHFEEIFKTLGT